jgi:hypothetical protein
MKRRRQRKVRMRKELESRCRSHETFFLVVLFSKKAMLSTSCEVRDEGIVRILERVDSKVNSHRKSNTVKETYHLYRTFLELRSASVNARKLNHITRHRCANIVVLRSGKGPSEAYKDFGLGYLKFSKVLALYTAFKV